MSNGFSLSSNKRGKREEGGRIERRRLDLAIGKPPDRRVMFTLPIIESSELRKRWCFIEGKRPPEPRRSGR